MKWICYAFECVEYEMTIMTMTNDAVKVRYPKCVIRLAEYGLSVEEQEVVVVVVELEIRSGRRRSVAPK
jgi:hypothetical protein